MLGHSREPWELFVCKNIYILQVVIQMKNHMMDQLDFLYCSTIVFDKNALITRKQVYSFS